MEFLLPISIMVFLNLFLIFRLLYMATMYTLSRDIKLSQFRMYEGEFPDKLRSARQQFQNMFEIPILFYLLCLLNIFLKNYNQLDIILCWCFVVFRVLHFFIRLQNQKTINIIPRTIIFVVSLVFLTLGWINLIINSFSV
ncbi:MAG: hypothetical protein CMF94_03645 [Candidatus Marinimicrobia bacterium]|nr:hypothetical protein [Candidatus Neomarinimicrobiota bacterium]